MTFLSFSSQHVKTSLENYKEEQSAKRKKGKGGGSKSEGGLEGNLTVQRLSTNVEGRCQKYSRLGALALVPFDLEPTLGNIKRACQAHFRTTSECDVLAGERGPSYSHENQIKNWKLIHVRFLEGTRSRATYLHSLPAPERPEKASVSRPVKSQMNQHVESSFMPKSVSLSKMMEVGKLVEPETTVVPLNLEGFSITNMKWQDPIQSTIVLNRNPFAQGGTREAFKAKALSGELPKGDYVLKQYKESDIPGIVKLFGSIEAHSRKSVQLHSLARNFAQTMEQEVPVLEFGQTSRYHKAYFATMGNKCITFEPFMDGPFVKYMNNNGTICMEPTEVRQKAETFAHFTFVRSSSQLMVTDIQGVGYSLCDPEIATSNQKDEGNNYYFCTGNLSVGAIQSFFEEHKCNKCCKMLKL